MYTNETKLLFLIDLEKLTKIGTYLSVEIN